MSLYLKYRPDNLDKVFGNTVAIKTVKGLLAGSKKDLPHTYLFHGPTGCGKTTIARILARELGCVGEDLIEIDTAQFRGIDTVRTLRKNIQYKAMYGKVRVYIIDEVHGATKEAQNAMLKIFEDTPPHVFFILCTTDPQKLISTIRGRCSEIKVQTLSDKEMEQLLSKVVKKEKDKLQEKVMDKIIQDSLGHPRNALQILQQVLATPPKQRLEVAERTSAEQNKAIELCRALFKGANWTKVKTILNDIKDQAPESIRFMVLMYCQNTLLKSDTPIAAAIMEEFMETTYANGFTQIVWNCYSLTHPED